MSDHEPSYYEIALTNRQVLVAFVILLCCVLAAFFAGVWVGRGDRGRPQVAQAEPAASDLSLEGAEEFEFFADEAEEPTSQVPSEVEPIARDPRPDTTLAEDLAGEPEGRPEPEPAAPATETRPAEPPPPAEPSRTEAAPPATSAPEPAPTRGTDPDALIIQVFSSRDEVQARRLVTRLKRANLPAFLSPVEVQGQTMYRVRVGPFEERRRAEAVAERVRRDFKVDTWITAATD